MGALPYRTFRRLFFVGASEYFETPFTRRLAQLMNVVPVDPDANLVRAMQAGAFGLRRDLVLTLFPEGERSPDGAPKRFKKGAAITALQTRVPIVPVALHGLFEIWPRGAGLRWGALLPWARTRCTIRFGRPVPPESSPGGGAGRYERHTELVRSAVVEMWEELERERTPARSQYTGDSPAGLAVVPAAGLALSRIPSPESRVSGPYASQGSPGRPKCP